MPTSSIFLLPQSFFKKNKSYIYVIIEYMFIMENECNRSYEFKKILNDEIHVIPTVFINF